MRDQTRRIGGLSARRWLPNYTSVIPPRVRVMTWLQHGVPIALITDLWDRDGPTSREIYRVEAVADDVRREADRLAAVEAAEWQAAQATDFTARQADW